MIDRLRDSVWAILVASVVPILAGALLVAAGSSFARSSIYGWMLRVVDHPVFLALFALASFGASFTASWWVARTRPATRRRTFASALVSGTAYVLAAAVWLAAMANAFLPADDSTAELLREGGWMGIVFYGAVATVLVAVVLSVTQRNSHARQPNGTSGQNRSRPM